MAVLVWTTAVPFTDEPTGVTSSPACALVIEFDGERYIGFGAPPEPYTVGERLGTTRIGPCRDTGPDWTPEPVTTAGLYRIEGLDPSDGLALAPGDLLARQLPDGGITPGFQTFLEAHGWGDA